MLAAANSYVVANNPAERITKPLGAASSKLVAYRKLIQAGRGDPNDIYVAGISATWMAGQGALPRWMGLPPSMFREMLDFHFPVVAREIKMSANHGQPESGDEISDLRHLLLSNRAGRSRSERWIAELICAGCMGRDHLWSDLGLISRPQLTEMMRLNFPRLAFQNTKNMRWKKFLYKRLCEGEGLYICRAPSCEVCSEKAVCFAPDSD